MKNKKPHTKSKKRSGKKQAGGVFDSIASASGVLKIATSVLKNAKRAGCPAFRSNRVYETELLKWLSENPVSAESNEKRDKKVDEEIRKLRIANDARESTLISRAWVAERIQRCAGEINAYRLRSENEHPRLFAATNGDIIQCREQVRTMWDEIMRAIQNLNANFA